ncbi:zinc finger protein with KRAB and SCAN domains 8-like [Solea solea]|uniref:zinc finger protein with KRAB and SCAN domains 8-like n=1 Tax=Solea solea TaxID=90069 RepID=UPI00272B999D|nr:zinc finger protein with KRAB and SCAN domains 8-like [Solea solea]
MSSLRYLRNLISERLTAAAEEIFRAFEQTIVEYEEEVDRQRRLLQNFGKRREKLHRIELPQQNVYNAEGVLTDSNHERNFSLDQEESESPQTKEDQEEICTSLEGEKNIFEYEVDHQGRLVEILWKPKEKLQRREFPQQHVYNEEEVVLTEQQLCKQERNSSLDQEESESLQIKEEEEEICISQEQLELKPEADTFMLTPNNEESAHMEPDSDHQLLSPVSESSDQTGSKQSVSTRNVESKPHKRHYKKGSYSSHTSKYKSKTQTYKNSFKCVTCGKKFGSNYQLSLHLRVHTGEKPFPCNTCSKCFRTKPEMLSHMRTHTGEKPYSCKTCGKCFRHRPSLMNHKRTHTGEKPYICSVCKSCFARKDYLMKHMGIHTGEKPHICNICQKCYRQKSDLTVHMRTHTGEKPYHCSTCGNSFRDGSYFKKHLRIHFTIPEKV